MDCVPHCVSRRIGDRNCVALCDIAERRCVMFLLMRLEQRLKKYIKEQKPREDELMRKLDECETIKNIVKQRLSITS